MKNLLALTLVSILIIIGLPACAAPLPTPHSNNVTLICDATSQPDIVVATQFYRSMPSDPQWHLIATITGTNSASCVASNSAFGEVFYAVYLDAQGNTSDAVSATNTITFSAPVNLKLTR